MQDIRKVNDIEKNNLKELLSTKTSKHMRIGKTKQKYLYHFRLMNYLLDFISLYIQYTSNKYIHVGTLCTLYYFTIITYTKMCITNKPST